MRWGRRSRNVGSLDRAAVGPVPQADRSDLSPPPSACFAPGSALYLRPDGLVMTCCGGWHALGRVNGHERASLRAIWDGDRRAELLAALQQGDFSLGCFSCKIDEEGGEGAPTLAREFDRYGPAPRAFPVMIDFALSDRCNLQCVQCSGTFSSAIRRHREGRAPLEPAYDDRFFDELDEFLPHLQRAQFKGGEPFLMRESRRVWDRLLELDLRPEISVTTNGTIWNRHVERYTRELAFDVIVSVDAVAAEPLEAIRVGAQADQVWENIDRFRAICGETGSTLTLSFCLMSINWDQLAPFLQTCDRLEVNPDVIWVGGPGNFCLLTMAHEGLVEVQAGFERADAEVGDLRPASRAIWDNALARVRAAVAGGDRSGVAVEIVARPDGALALAGRLREAAREMGVDDVAHLLRLDYVDEVLTSVQAPAWSEPLQPEGWLGIGLRETITTIASSSGGSMKTEVEPVEGGGHRLSITFDTSSRVRSLRGMSVPHPDTPGSICVLFAEVGEQIPGPDPARR